MSGSRASRFLRSNRIETSLISDLYSNLMRSARTRPSVIAVPSTVTTSPFANRWHGPRLNWVSLVT